VKSKILQLVAAALLFFVGDRLARSQDTKPVAGTNPAPKSGALLPEDRRLLDRLLTEFVFDPQGARFVSMPLKTHDDLGADAEVTRQGWLIPANAKRPARIYLGSDDNLMTVPAGANVENLDFIALSRKRYGAGKAPDAGNHPVYGPANDFEAILDLVNAAWLHRLGEDKLASEALERARERVPNPGEAIGKQPAPNSDAAMVASVQETLAGYGYQRMIRDFMLRADEAALAENQRLIKLYPKRAAQLGQPEAVIVDLERRRKNGSFGRAPPEEWPSDYSEWDTAKKRAYLIDALDEVDARQQSHPGYGDLLGDRRIAALAEIGDAAVPALIDTIETDNRLTRAVFDSFENEPRPILLSVRQAAFITVMAILRVRVFQPGVADRAMTLKGSLDRKRILDALRAYWKINGSLPFESRMMKQLTDLKATREEWRESAYNLANPQSPRVVMGDESGNMVWSASPAQADVKPSAAVMKLSNPTAAEAMLAALDRDLATETAKPAAPEGGPDPFVSSLRDQINDRARREIEDAYLLPIAQLRDHRIAPELARRCAAAKTLRARCQLALAAHLCGNSEPLKRFCRAFEQGKLELPHINEITEKLDVVADRMLQQRAQDLVEAVTSLIASHLPEADKALYALAYPEHPQNKFVARLLLRMLLPNEHLSVMPSAGHSDFELSWHPYCLAVLRRELDNKQPTEVVSRSKDGRIETTEEGSPAEGQPNKAGNPRLDPDQESQRICDLAAWKISDMAWGMPDTEPPATVSEDRLAAMKKILDRYRGRFHEATREESDALNDGPMLIPTWPPLSRPATAADVATGHAVFELGGRGKIAPLKLPAVGTFTSTVEGQSIAESVLILQAEIGADGKTLYGAVGRNILRAIPADQLTDIRPLESPWAK
jgi:hypothetical protein